MKHLAAAGIICLLLTNVSCLGSSGSGCAAECHNTPPATGAHLSHTDGLLPMRCDECHGEGASDSDHPGHNNSSLTILGQDDYEADHGTRPAWYGSIWGDAAAFDGFDPASSICSGLVCHGLDPVGWTQDMESAAYNLVCKGCHDITPAVFTLPGYGTIFQASTAAANYDRPLGGFGRGGHGDEEINDPAWFKDSAPGSSVPLACVACHDFNSPHFPVADGNPYRMPAAALANNLPGASGIEGPITNLCTQTTCHPKVLGTGVFGFLSPIKHPSDNYPITAPVEINMFANTTAPIFSALATSLTSPAYDPVGRANPVGLYIDRYVDHWAYWNPSSPATADTSDDEPFLPLGDPLLKQIGDVFDNYADTASMLVVCTTCHNPHGADLHVVGQVPGVASSLTSIPSNKMLRLRDQDGELCVACH